MEYKENLTEIKFLWGLEKTIKPGMKASNHVSHENIGYLITIIEYLESQIQELKSYNQKIFNLECELSMMRDFIIQLTKELNEMDINVSTHLID